MADLIIKFILRQNRDSRIKTICSCIAFTEVIKTKTRIIFESWNEDSEKKNISKDFENEVKKAMLLALKEEGYLTQIQYDECARRMKRESD